MVHKIILRKVFAQIPGVTDEEIDMAVDSVIHANEVTFSDAIKNMATKDDIKDMATKADVRAAKIETETHIAKLESKLAWRLLGFATAIILINLAGTGLMLHLLLPG